MSELVDTHDLRFIHYEIASESLLKFCMRLVHHSQWKNKRSFSSGSTVELTDRLVVALEFDIDCKKLDLARMTYKTYRYAFPRPVLVPETYAGEVLRIYTDNLHPGFLRLIQEKIEPESVGLYCESVFIRTAKNMRMHGPRCIA